MVVLNSLAQSMKVQSALDVTSWEGCCDLGGPAESERGYCCYSGVDYSEFFRTAVTITEAHPKSILDATEDILSIYCMAGWFLSSVCQFFN